MWALEQHLAEEINFRGTCYRSQERASNKVWRIWLSSQTNHNSSIKTIETKHLTQSLLCYYYHSVDNIIIIITSVLLLWLKKIIWVIAFLRRTVVSDWRFDNMCGSHLLSLTLMTLFHLSLFCDSANIIRRFERLTQVKYDILNISHNLKLFGWVTNVRRFPRARSHVSIDLLQYHG